MLFKYKSWVPNVTGRLSFSEIGSTSHPSRCVRANEGDADKRFIIAYQRRVTLDAIVPKKEILSRKFYGLEGEMWFACAARTESHNERAMEKLCGKIFIFHKKELWRGWAERTVKLAQEKLRNSMAFSDDQSIKNFDQTYNSTLSELQKLSSFNVNFELIRTGDVEINHDTNDPHIENAPYFGDPPNEHLVHIVASQTFFFLKDISHNHQHHRPNTDTILDIYPFKSERYWREQVIYSLYRKIIQYKRNPNIRTISDSRGVLAYAKAFLGVCEENFSESSRTEKLPRYDNETLEMSLIAAGDHISWHIQEKNRRADNIQNWLIGVLGSVLALTALLSLTKAEISEVNPAILFVGELILKQPTILIFMIAIPLLFIFNITEKRFFRNVVRFLSALRRDVAVFLMFIFSLGGIIYIIFSDTFSEIWKFISVGIY